MVSFRQSIRSPLPRGRSCQEEEAANSLHRPKNTKHNHRAFLAEKYWSQVHKTVVPHDIEKFKMQKREKKKKQDDNSESFTDDEPDDSDILLNLTDDEKDVADDLLAQYGDNEDTGGISLSGWAQIYEAGQCVSTDESDAAMVNHLELMRSASRKRRVLQQSRLHERRCKYCGQDYTKESEQRLRDHEEKTCEHRP
jgi:hypothetical protein